VNAAQKVRRIQVVIPTSWTRLDRLSPPGLRLVVGELAALTAHSRHQQAAEMAGVRGIGLDSQRPHDLAEPADIEIQQHGPARLGCRSLNRLQRDTIRGRDLLHRRQHVDNLPVENLLTELNGDLLVWAARIDLGPFDRVRRHSWHLRQAEVQVRRGDSGRVDLQGRGAVVGVAEPASDGADAASSPAFGPGGTISVR
jgi:hypothetical protein